jgi:uncharacterized phage protein (TIGR01671 family)
MRKHKYRVWDKDEHKWLELSGDIFLAFSDGEMQVIEGSQEYAEEHENVEIVEWTGLKDRNNKEIYEGDIVQAIHRIHDCGDDKENLYNYFQVTFLNGNFMFGNNNAHEFFNKYTFREVIGNIFENPELLEGEI